VYLLRITKESKCGVIVDLEADELVEFCRGEAERLGHINEELTRALCETEGELREERFQQ